MSASEHAPVDEALAARTTTSGIGGKDGIGELRAELASLRRVVWLMLLLILGVSLGLGYCAVYFRKRCNGFELKLDQLSSGQSSSTRGPSLSAVTSPAPAASALEPAPLVEDPPATWTPPALPGGLPPPPDLATLMPAAGAGDRPLPSRPLLDELDLYEQGNRVFFENASYYFRSRGAFAGQHCLEIQLEDAPGGAGRVVIEPRLLTLPKGTHLSFACRKSRADARLWVGLLTPAGTAIVMRESRPPVPPGHRELKASTAWHEIDFDPHELARAQGVDFGTGRVAFMFFGLTHGATGDSVFIDRVWTGPAPVRGVPAPTGKVRLAGKLTGPTAGASVVLVHGGREQRTTPAADGSYEFRDLPAGAIVELWAEVEGRRRFSPAGDVLHLASDVSDAHILGESLAALRGAKLGPVKPEWSNYGGPGVAEYSTQFPPHKPMFYTGVIGKELEYSATLVPNRFGVYDRDHRFENPDQRPRVLVLGDCMVEGIQSEVYQRVGPRLEAMLRRRHGRDTEVLTLAHSNAHPAAVWPMYEKLGRKFRPDLVLIDVNAPSVVQMEARLLKNLTGWDPEHSAYSGMMLKDDQLKLIPPDPNYPVFASKPTFAPLQGVPPSWVLHIKEEAFCPEAKELRNILKAVIAKYVQDARDFGGRVVVFTGSRAATYPKPQTFEGKAAAQETYVENMKRWAREAGAEHVDISTHIQKHPQFDALYFWKNDGHPTDTGHHWMAESLAHELVSAGMVP